MLDCSGAEALRFAIRNFDSAWLLARGRATLSVLRCTNLDQKCENPVRHFPRYIELSPKCSTNIRLNGP